MPFNKIGKRFAIIEEFPDYAVTDDGEVWSYKDKFKARAGLRKLSPHKTSNGYSYVHCVDKERYRRFAIHRLVGYYFCNGYFEGAVINHIDANIENNHYTNLEWVTQRENVNKSYITSGLDQTRNYCLYRIEYPCGALSPILKSGKQVTKYINENNLNVKATMLLKHRDVDGFLLHKVEK